MPKLPEDIKTFIIAVLEDTEHSSEYSVSIQDNLILIDTSVNRDILVKELNELGYSLRSAVRGKIMQRQRAIERIIQMNGVLRKIILSLDL